MRKPTHLLASRESHAPGMPTLDIDAVARELREALVPVLQAAAGKELRPMKLSRAIGIDKSLASVLVRAVNAPSDRDLLHLIPSPTGLRILSERTRALAPRAASAKLNEAIESLRGLLETTPGGRAALDAEIAETSHELGRKRENTSRQAAFKAMSFLLGYYSDSFSSTMFLVPSEDGKTVDAIEVSRRLGARRMRSSATVPMFSYVRCPERPSAGAMRFDSIDGDPAGPNLHNLLLPKFCTDPMPEVEVVREQDRTTVVLPGNNRKEPIDITWCFRLRNAGLRDPGPGLHVLHTYFLHMPTRRLVRDLFIAKSVHPGATPMVAFAQPGTRASENPPMEGKSNYFAQVDLSVELEPLPAPKRAFNIAGFPGQDHLVREVLERAGHGETEFRGWRSAITYPVPLLEMNIWLSHPE